MWAGILLPSSVLTSRWFMWLATMVAFNTIVYLGLTLSKLIPLPKQIHPSRVRHFLAAFDPNSKFTSPTNEPAPRPSENVSPYENMRRNIALREIPQAFALVGGFVLLLSAAAIVASAGTSLTDNLVELVLGLVFLLTSQILARGRFRATTMRWVWVVGATILVEVFIVEATHDRNQMALAYTLITLTAFAPVTLAWRPVLVAGSVQFFSVAVAAFTVQGTEDLRILVSSFAALAISATLLKLRLSALDALSDEQSRSEALASTDVLTGCLTRNGLQSLMPTLGGIAQRLDEHVCVMFFDINQLEQANVDYGRKYGDDLLCEVADQIRACVRTGDMVARWGDDEFMVVGLGNRPDAQALSVRISEAVRIAGVNLGRWPVTVKAGTASGDPEMVTFDQLITEAKADLPSGV